MITREQAVEMKTSPLFPHLFEVGQIGRVKIRNRIVCLPMTTAFAGINGEVTQRTIDSYVAMAEGGTGLIFVGAVKPTGYPSVMGLNLHSDLYLSGHYELVEAVHAHSAKIACQLVHPGRAQPTALLEGKQLVSSSPVARARPFAPPGPVPRALDRVEIYQMAEKYAAAAGRAKQVGYDMVEVLAAHGHLISSFMSPYLNKRRDEFGGSLENRMRFLLELIKRIKEVVGEDYPLGIRINGDEFLQGGITIQESPIMARMLEEAGVAYINISSGLAETADKVADAMRYREGWKAYMWEAIKRAVNIPTIAGGGLRTPAFCEEILAQQKADFVGLARSLLADPEWPNKAARGTIDDIRPCIRCMECLDGSLRRRQGGAARHCAVNAEYGRNREFAEIKPTPSPKRVVIVGGGPAGMEAARVAAQRGHRVTLYEKKRVLGGQMLLAAAPPGKDILLSYRDYMANQLKKLGVKIELGNEVTPELVDEVNPDAVIVATGAEPLIANFPGVDSERVVTAWDVLQGKIELRGKKVVVVGGGIVGCETAEHLSERGNQVTVVEMLSRMAADMHIINRIALLQALEEKQVVLLEREVVEISATGIVVIDKTSGEREVIEADWVVLAMGSKPVQWLAEALGGKVAELYTIGDCNEPRVVMEAVYEGALVARQI